MQNKTIIAFDFGTKSIGVAIGQTITRTARSLTSLKARDGIPDWQQIQQLFAEWQPDLVIVGLPFNMDGSEQDLTNLARKFARRLHGRFNITVALQDERLSTVEAKSLLFEHYGYKSLTKGKIDAMAAVIILQSWFENN